MDRPPSMRDTSNWQAHDYPRITQVARECVNPSKATYKENAPQRPPRAPKRLYNILPTKHSISCFERSARPQRLRHHTTYSGQDHLAAIPGLEAVQILSRDQRGRRDTHPCSRCCRQARCSSGRTWPPPPEHTNQNNKRKRLLTRHHSSTPSSTLNPHPSTIHCSPSACIGRTLATRDIHRHHHAHSATAPWHNHSLAMSQGREFSAGNHVLLRV